MEKLYSFVDDLEDLSNKITRLERTVVRVLEQTTECGIFLREYTASGFIRKLHRRHIICVNLTERSSARISGQVTSHRRQVVTNLSSALRSLQEDLNAGVMLHTAFVSGQIQDGVDRLGASNQLHLDMGKGY